jgi:hypothetical protein
MIHIFAIDIHFLHSGEEKPTCPIFHICSSLDWTNLGSGET